MYKSFALLCVALCVGLCLGGLEYQDQWESGYRAVLTHHLQEAVTDGWHLVLKFDNEPREFETYAAIVESQDGASYTLVNQEWDPSLPEGDFPLEFTVGHDEANDPPALLSAVFNGVDVDLGNVTKITKKA